MAKRITVLLYAAAAVGIVWLTARYLLRWVAPFLVAYALAFLLEIPVRYLVRHGWRRSAAAGLLTVSLLGLLIWGVAALTMKCVSSATAFAREVPGLMAAAGENLSALEERAFAYAASAPEGIDAYLTTAIESLGGVLYDLPSMISQKALEIVTKTAQHSPDILLFAVTAALGTYFLSASFPRTNAFIAAQLPEQFRQRLEGLESDLKNSFGGFIRSQLILMAMTFFELLGGFMILDVKNAAAIAAVTAVVDALPIFGTGIVLVPWALYSLLLGSTRLGIGLVICWLAVTLLRNCVQAKLLGDQIGLDPLASLLSIYVGWRVWHVWGMLLFPLILVTLQQLNDKGVIRLWRPI